MKAGFYGTAELNAPGFFDFVFFNMNISVVVNAFRVIIMNSPAPRFYGSLCIICKAGLRTNDRAAIVEGREEFSSE